MRKGFYVKLISETFIRGNAQISAICRLLTLASEACRIFVTYKIPTNIIFTFTPKQTMDILVLKVKSVKRSVYFDSRQHAEYKYMSNHNGTIPQSNPRFGKFNWVIESHKRCGVFLPQLMSENYTLKKPKAIKEGVKSAKPLQVSKC